MLAKKQNNQNHDHNIIMITLKTQMAVFVYTMLFMWQLLECYTPDISLCVSVPDKMWDLLK